MLAHPVRHWLSIRIRLLCVTIFAVSTLLPPYIPKEALADSGGDLGETSQFLLVEDGFLMKSSSLTQQGSRRAYAEGIIHEVRDGESIEKIADRYGIEPDTIRWANKLETSTIRPGQQLIILPVDGVLHTVTRGQTLSRIAQLYDIPAVSIVTQNNIEGSFILAGQELIIPGARPIVPAAPTQVATTPTPTKPTTGTPSTPTPSVSVTETPSTASAEIAAPTPGVLQMPCSGCRYTQYFNASHYAVDIQTRGGGPIYAAEAGTVIRADKGWNGGYGNVIEVDHGNGLVTLYAHNKALHVGEGDTVVRGQHIADMGNTGRVYGATGIHVHFEVRINGVKKNPLLYLQ